MSSLSSWRDFGYETIAKTKGWLCNGHLMRMACTIQLECLSLRSLPLFPSISLQSSFIHNHHQFLPQTTPCYQPPCHPPLFSISSLPYSESSSFQTLFLNAATIALFLCLLANLDHHACIGFHCWTRSLFISLACLFPNPPLNFTATFQTHYHLSTPLLFLSLSLS